MGNPIEMSEPNPIATFDEEEPTYPDTGICPNCKVVGLEQESDCLGVVFGYKFIDGTWKEIDQNWYGNCETTYKCTNCKWSSDK